MSGLAAGVRLAHFGQRVCILERHSAIGGLNSYYRLGGRNYDVGLHAVTNYRPRGDRRGPLAKLLRQLRLNWDDFALVPQLRSRIAFPEVSLEFNNDPALLESQVAARFPAQVGPFRRLLEKLADYEALGTPATAMSARKVVGDIISDPLLVEMLFCPIMFYGSASEHDLDFGQFSVLFRSIFLEGLARPAAGVRRILKTLVLRFKDLGGELRLRAGVQRLAVEADEVQRVVLENGAELLAREILSSAGWAETLRLCGAVAISGGAAALSAAMAPAKAAWNNVGGVLRRSIGGASDPGSAVASIPPASAVESSPSPAIPASGKLSFIESVSTLDVSPAKLGCEETMVFFNDSPNFVWQRPDDLADVRSGVICAPSNFDYPADSTDRPPEPALRLTALANYERWMQLDDEQYAEAKRTWYERLVASALRFIPDFRSHVVAMDMFTPKTIRHFTGHDNGAVYGAPQKRYDGTTMLKNLFLCGTDQGLVGIIGAMTSGIVMANRLLGRVLPGTRGPSG